MIDSACRMLLTEMNSLLSSTPAAAGQTLNLLPPPPLTDRVREPLSCAEEGKSWDGAEEMLAKLVACAARRDQLRD